MYRSTKWKLMDDSVLAARLMAGKHPFRFGFTRRPYWSW